MLVETSGKKEIGPQWQSRKGLARTADMEIKDLEDITNDCVYGSGFRTTLLKI